MQLLASYEVSEEVGHASQYADSAYLFCHHVQYKKGMLSQHFVTHVVPPLMKGGSVGENNLYQH